MIKKARLIFEDGKVFFGRVFADAEDCFGEVVFNTAMTGYQEILTDPSYCGQIVVMTYPLIGSYGVNEEDVESRDIFLSAFIVKEYIDAYSNWRGNKTLKTYLEQHQILGIEGVDTRSLTKYIRETGAKKAFLTTSTESLETLIQKVNASKSMTGQNLAEKVTCKVPYDWAKPQQSKYKVAVIDCGVKRNILEMLREVGCESTVYPVSTASEEILDSGFDGVFVSNGPGDPEPVQDAVNLVRSIVGKLPLFGICLGHQILSLALGAKTFKLKFGHHGANHPIMNLETGKVEITSQNHGFAIDPDSIDKREVDITHVNLNDETIAGIRHKRSGAFSVQYHPESSPGPHDSMYFFKDFTELMTTQKTKG